MPCFSQWPILEANLMSMPLCSSKSEGKRSKKNEKFSLARCLSHFWNSCLPLICINISCLLLRFFKIQNKMNIVILIESKQWNKVMLCFQTTSLPPLWYRRQQWRGTACPAHFCLKSHCFHLHPQTLPAFTYDKHSQWPSLKVPIWITFTKYLGLKRSLKYWEIRKLWNN